MKISVDEFSKIVDPEDIVITRSELLGYSVYGQLPQLAVLPRTYEQVSEIVSFCNSSGYSLLPFGGRTKALLGNKPLSYDIALSTLNLNNVIEHSEKDFIITVQAGTALEQVQNLLAEKKQFLALDPPLVESGATIGGIIATNHSGPLRLRYGTCREQIIEIKVVRADGTIIHGGAKVVKNVAGYDIPKLYVGSFGTLGIIVEATFRVFPLQETSSTYISGFDSIDQLKSSVDSLLGADIEMSSLEIINEEMASNLFRLSGIRPINFPYTILVKIENIDAAVNDQVEIVKGILNNERIEGALIDNDIKVWDFIRNFTYDGEKNSATCRLSVLYTDFPKTVEHMEEISENLGIRLLMSSNISLGLINLLVEADNKDLAVCLDLLRSYITTIKGTMIIERLPEDFEKFDCWGDFGSSAGVMRSLKERFDRNNILNPGRLF